MNDTVKARYFVLWAKGGKISSPFRVLDSLTGEQRPCGSYDEAGAEVTRLNKEAADRQRADTA